LAARFYGVPPEPGRIGTAAAEEAGVEETARCSVCTRAPLVGESVTVVARGRRESVVCGLCDRKPRAAALGETVRAERVRTAVGAATVRRDYPRPVPGVRPRTPLAPQL
jgi:hypothetical protein